MTLRIIKSRTIDEVCVALIRSVRHTECPSIWRCASLESPFDYRSARQREGKGGGLQLSMFSLGYRLYTYSIQTSVVFLVHPSVAGGTVRSSQHKHLTDGYAVRSLEQSTTSVCEASRRSAPPRRPSVSTPPHLPPHVHPPLPMPTAQSVPFEVRPSTVCNHFLMAWEGSD